VPLRWRFHVGAHTHTDAHAYSDADTYSDSDSDTHTDSYPDANSNAHTGTGDLAAPTAANAAAALRLTGHRSERIRAYMPRPSRCEHNVPVTDC
jgi:hypothetical protein